MEESQKNDRGWPLWAAIGIIAVMFVVPGTIVWISTYRGEFWKEPWALTTLTAALTTAVAAAISIVFWLRWKFDFEKSRLEFQDAKDKREYEERENKRATMALDTEREKVVRNFDLSEKERKIVEREVEQLRAANEKLLIAFIKIAEALKDSKAGNAS